MFILTGLLQPGYVQGQPETDRLVRLDIALSGGSGRGAIALSAYRLPTPFAKIPRLRIGYGIRFTGFVAANKFYTTAPSRLTSPVQNPFTIFSKTIESNIDTVTTATAQTNSLNIAVYFEYSISKKIDAGFNIDAAGFSFGKSRNFNIISSDFDPNQSPVQQGSPTRWNLLLTSDNDYGSLNSEFYLAYALVQRLSIKAGFTFLFSEYTTENELHFRQGQIANDRYRYKASMLLIGVHYKL